jgi:hypothetical protein
VQRTQQKISVANPALLFCLWSGKLTDAGAILGEVTSSLDMKRVSPADAISLKLMESISAWLRAEYSEALGVLAQAADMAHVSGVHILNYQISAQTAWAALGAGDLELAARAIADAKAVLQPGRQADVLTSRALEQGLALTRGSVSVSTAAAMREVVELARKISMPFVEADSRLIHAQILNWKMQMRVVARVQVVSVASCCFAPHNSASRPSQRRRCRGSPSDR